MEALIIYMSQFVTPNRLQLFEAILLNRTRYITVVLEDIHQAQNASAIVRTCDCLGIQDVHVIENKNTYKVNHQIALGAEKWLTIYHHKSILSAIQGLKEDGYRIVATSSTIKGESLDSFDLSIGKAAFVFGTELTGISDEAIDLVDEFIKIPMVGFTESFNISVAVGILTNFMTCELRQSDIPWNLNSIDRNEIKLQWLKNTIKKADLLINHYQVKMKTRY